MDKCHICGFPLKYFRTTGNDSYSCDCYRCGKYSISIEAYSDLDGHITTESQVANLSGWIRENQNEFITTEKLKRLSSITTPNVSEKANRILLYLSRIYPIPGQSFQDIYYTLDNLNEHIKSAELQNHQVINAEKLFPIFSIGYAASIEEIEYLLYDYLFREKKYLNLDGNQKMTPKGWAFIESYNSKNPESKIAFIAMKFDDSLKDFSEKWVETAIRETGFEPIRIDKYQHNNIIDDEIIANIKRSRFLIADLTGNSYGVYFEAGFAKGLDLPVIYLCNENYFNNETDKVHFDTNHYPFILWNNTNGNDLMEKLKNRIEATIGLVKKY